MSAFHELKLTALDGQELPLAPFKGQVVLVVNVASKCGLTPQYAALENLYQQYKGKGFSVLGSAVQPVCRSGTRYRTGNKELLQPQLWRDLSVVQQAEVNGHERHQLYKLAGGRGRRVSR